MMRKIKIKKYDQLQGYILELSCIAYLQSVIQYDNYAMIDELCEIYGEAKNYLTDREIEIIIKLRDLVYDKDFTLSDET